MKSKIWIGGLLLFVLLVALSVRAARATAQVNTAAAALARQRDALRVEIVRLEAALEVAGRAAAESREQLAALGVDPEHGDAPAPSAEAKTKSPGLAPATSRPPSPITLVANDPQKWAEYRKNYREAVELDYGANFKWLGLTPEQREKFKDAELWCEETSIDLQAAVELHRLDQDSAEYKKLWSDYNKSRVTRKEEALGELTPKYLEYFRTESVRWFPRELAYAGIFSAEAITAAQIEHVADILVANCKRNAMNSRTKSGPFAYPSGLNWPAASAQLQGILSPNQIETLGFLIEQDKTSDRLSERRESLTARFKSQLAPK